jgi:Co/Zn/Cd efflux system component
LAIMMESTPEEVNITKLKHAILSIDDNSLICSIHDLHCWKLGGTNNSFTCHVKVHPGKNC